MKHQSAIRSIITLFILGFISYYILNSQTPDPRIGESIPLTEFSTDRAFTHVKAMSKEPHYVGSKAHSDVREYVMASLRDLGLEVQLQEGYTIDRWGNLSKPTNILARIKGSGTGKAVMLCSHYDSDPHSSLGASDAASGVATVLEGLRAYLATGQQPVNDIIVLITDSEELGLNGAELFSAQHEWADEVGVILNFEARGSGGPSYLLLESNGGNSAMVNAFAKAGTTNPVANSLAYSIYKIMPSDTDLTAFRTIGDIDGFNFAFVDDHYDYHTQLDSAERLDPETLAHQGSYITGMLSYFAENDTNVKAETSDVYFNIADLGIVKYPFGWGLPIAIIIGVFLLLVIIYGAREHKINSRSIFKGLGIFLLSVVVAGGLTYGYWELMKLLSTQYSEMEHGFTYNGYSYINAALVLGFAVSMFLYSKIYKPENIPSLIVGPLIIWWIIGLAATIYLSGAGYFILPVFFGTLMLLMYIRQQKPSGWLLLLLSIPTLVILVPFLQNFPVALGLKILYVPTILIALTLGLLVPITGRWKIKKSLSILGLLFFLLLSAQAVLQDKWTVDTPKPNSLNYIYYPEQGKALWTTYDEQLDDWSKHVLGDTPDDATTVSQAVMDSKYKSSFTYAKEATVRDIKIFKDSILSDTIIGLDRLVTIRLSPQRHVNRFEIFADKEYQFRSFKVNGAVAPRKGNEEFVMKNRYYGRMMSYYLADQTPLTIEMMIPADQQPVFTIYEASFDLIDNPLFPEVKRRAENMIPKPFVLNDAILTTKKVNIPAHQNIETSPAIDGE